MQKKLIALALASLAGSAFAQSNVTIYGVADASFDIAKAGGATTSGNDRGSFTRVNSNSSHIGFKGVEDLGNGLKAVFQFENSVNFDAGGWGSTRDTFVGLAGNWGTLVAGNLTGPTRALGYAFDLNAGATGPGANSSLIGKPVGGSGSGVLDTRLSNTVAYISPTFSGFTAIAGYMSGENKTLDSATDATKANLKAFDLGLNYNNGPIAVGLAYAYVDAGTNDAFTGTVNSTSTGNGGALNHWANTRLAGSYTFNGGHKIVALWDHADVNLADSDKAKRNTWGLGGKFMVTTNGGLIVQYYQAQKLKLNSDSVDNSGAKLYEIGYEHSLSKRTMLKASYSQIKNQSAANYDFNVGSVGGFSDAAAAPGADPQVISVGVRHSF